MAAVTIEIEENEFNLYDFTLKVNDTAVATDGNYTSQGGAEDAAKTALDKWFVDRV